MIGCLQNTPDLVLFFGFIGVMTGEIGRSLFSGQSKDAYNQSCSYISHQSTLLADELIAKCEILDRDYLHRYRIYFSSIASSLVTYSFYLNNWFSGFLLATPFFLAILIHLKAFKSSICWKKWAYQNLVSRNSEFNGNPLGQLKAFLWSFDWMWAVGAGGIIYILVYSINFSAITLSDVPSATASGTLQYWHVIFVTFLACIPPLAVWLSNLIWKKNENKKLHKLHEGSLGNLLLLAWFLLVTTFINYRPNDPALLVIFCFSLAGLFGPLQTWIGWRRIPLLNFISNHSQFSHFFGSSHVFYYSLIYGGIESSIAFAGIYLKISEETSPANFIFGVGSISILLIFTWQIRRNLAKSSANRSYSISNSTGSQ